MEIKKYNITRKWLHSYAKLSVLHPNGEKLYETFSSGLFRKKIVVHNLRNSELLIFKQQSSLNTGFEIINGDRSIGFLQKAELMKSDLIMNIEEKEDIKIEANTWRTKFHFTTATKDIAILSGNGSSWTRLGLAINGDYDEMVIIGATAIISYLRMSGM